MYKSIDQLKLDVTQQIDERRLNDALCSIKEFVEQVISNPLSVATVFGSLLLDELCQKIGKKVLKKTDRNLSKKISAASNPIVYVATQLYMQGGHTAVIEDFIRAQSQCEHVIIINDIFDTKDREQIEKRFAFENVKLIWSPEGTLLDRLNWLQDKLYFLQAKKIFLFNHYQDSVVISAIQSDMSPEIFFYHHCDHHLCLGVCLDYTIHIDLHNLGFFNCREKLEIKNNIYLPLVSTDLGARSKDLPFFEGGVLRTCSSGTSNKFEFPYLYKYEDLIPKILQATRGVHIHIGGIEPRMLEVINQSLDRCGINRECFILIPWVKSLWQELINQKIDLYISSFPIGGGKASVEVMGSGTPIIAHENYKSQLLGCRFIIYPEAFCWKKPEELLNYLSTIDADILIKHSTLARKHYEAYHLPSLFENQLNNSNGECKGLTPAKLHSYAPDAVLAYLDLCNVVELFLQKKIQEKIQEVEILRAEINSIKKECNALYQSTSWRLTRPVRMISGFLQRLYSR